MYLHFIFNSDIRYINYAYGIFKKKINIYKKTNYYIFTQFQQRRLGFFQLVKIIKRRATIKNRCNTTHPPAYHKVTLRNTLGTFLPSIIIYSIILFFHYRDSKISKDIRPQIVGSVNHKMHVQAVSLLIQSAIFFLNHVHNYTWRLTFLYIDKYYYIQVLMNNINNIIIMKTRRRLPIVRHILFVLQQAHK